MEGIEQYEIGKGKRRREGKIVEQTWKGKKGEKEKEKQEENHEGLIVMMNNAFFCESTSSWIGSCRFRLIDTYTDTEL